MILIFLLLTAECDLLPASSEGDILHQSAVRSALFPLRVMLSTTGLVWPAARLMANPV